MRQSDGGFSEKSKRKSATEWRVASTPGGGTHGGVYHCTGRGAAYCMINLKELYRTCQLISNRMGIPIPRNKAIIGGNAFAHSSGIHQDGIIKDRSNY